MEGNGEAGVVASASLPRWDTTKDRLPAGNAAAGESSSFPFDARLNHKVILWQGDLCNLDVDAVVNTTSERLNDHTGISGRIFARAGPELVAECTRAEGCHTGEAVITKGCDLHAAYVIHTVGPRFSVKYQTAAENALHGCYRRCMEVLKENGLTSIAFPVVATPKKGYPKEPAAHVAFRTVRRFLEKYGATIETVVFAVESEEELRLYERVLPVYFPRDPDEEVAAKSYMPAEIGNELGESVIPDRQIRIGAMPGMSGDDPAGYAAPALHVSTVAVGAAGAAAAAAAGEVGSPVPKRDSFAGSMDENPDDVRRRADMGKPKDQLEREEAERRYAQYLRRAREEDLSDLEQYNFIYTSGVDSMGREVVVFVANQLPAQKVSLDRILLYLIRFLDPIVVRDYTIVYFHTNIQPENRPPMAWLQEVYKIFNRKYKKNLKRLFIVHPTWLVKTVLFFVSPFVSSKFWKKLRKVDALLDVYDELNEQTLRVPKSILDYDQEENRALYAARFGQPNQGSAEPARPVEEAAESAASRAQSQGDL